MGRLREEPRGNKQEMEALEAVRYLAARKFSRSSCSTACALIAKCTVNRVIGCISFFLLGVLWKLVYRCMYCWRDTLEGGFGLMNTAQFGVESGDC